MAYAHIKNLYKEQTILLFKECYALEKVHGTSAHVIWKEGGLGFYSGGATYERFLALFDHEELACKFRELDREPVTIYGEAYGGRLQRMSKTYGKELQFIAFEVKIGNTWLCVKDAEDVVAKLGLRFIPWRIVPATVEALDAERDRYSEVAAQNGMGEDKQREGVVIRPLKELTMSNGARVICKHKGDSFRETHTPRKVKEKQEITEDEKAAIEWVTEERLRHVLDKISYEKDISETPKIIASMLEDVMREGEGEIKDTKETRKAICRATASLWKTFVQQTDTTQGDEQ